MRKRTGTAMSETLPPQYKVKKSGRPKAKSGARPAAKGNYERWLGLADHGRYPALRRTKPG